MANNQASGRHLQLDDYDFNSDFDFDFDFDLTPKPPKDSREAIWRVTSTAGKTLSNSLKSPTFFQSIVKKSLPREYGQAWDLAEKSVGTLRDLYNDSVKELRPALRDLARTTEKLMPTAEKYLPKKVADELKDFTTKYGARSGPDTMGLASKSEEDMAVADILGKLYRFTAESEGKRTAQGDIKEHIRENIQQERHLDQIAQLDNIRSNINQMAGYQRKVEYNFHRKSLELQARSYFVQVETLREAKRQNVRTTEHLSAILHNTALPDYVKMKTSEQFMQQTKSKFMNGITNNITGLLGDSLFGRRANYIGNLREGFKQQAGVAIQGASRGLRQGLFGLDTMIDDLTREDSTIDKYTAGGHFLGSSISKFLNNQISKRIGRRIENDPNGWGRRVRRFGNRLQYGVENAPQHLSEFANTTNSAEDYMQNALDSINNRFNDPISYSWQRRITNLAGKVGNPLLDFGRDALRRTQNYDTQIKEGNVTTLGEPAVFTNHARKSITEIIPGYLARIHQELRILRTGDTNVDLVQYDFDKNGFDTSSNVKKGMFSRLVTKSDKENTDRDLDRVLNLLDPQNTLTAKQRKVLSNRLLQDNLSGAVGRAGSLQRYSSASQFNGSDEERKHAAAFAALFKSLKDSDADGLKQVDFAQRFGRLGQSSQDVRALVQQYADMGGRPMLEEIGVLEPGSNKINRQRLIEYQSGRKFNARATRAGGAVTAPRLGNTPPLIPHDEQSTIHQGIDLEPVTDGLSKLGRDLVALDPRPKLTDIHETLKLMQARLEEGILTVPYEQIMSELQRIRGSSTTGRRGILGRAARSVTSLGGLLTMSLGDLIKGSARMAGKGINAAGWLGNQLVGGTLRTAGKLAGGVASMGFGALTTVAGNAYRRNRGFIDIYVGNERKPRMYARMMQEGNVYFDKETNKPIRRMKDITGTVVSRINGEEKVVLEEDEIEQAWQKEGAVKKMIKTLGAVARTAKKVGELGFSIVGGGIPLVYRAGLWGLKKAYGLLDMPQDVYVKGGDGNPVLLARVMRNGGYRSATTGKVISRPSQIDGPVVVGEGDHEELALTHDDIKKGLLDSHGKPLRTGLAKLFNLAFGGVSSAFQLARWAGKKVGNATIGLLKGGVRLGKNILKTGINVAGFGLDLMRGKPIFEGMYGQAVMAGLQVQQEGNGYLKEIRDILNERMKDPKKHDWSDADGDGIRDGSYDDELKKEKAKKKQEEEAKAKTASGQAGVGGGGMFSGMKAMWDKLRGKKGGDEDEDGVNVDINGVNTGNGNTRDERRQRRLNRLKPKGFWGKTKYLAGKTGRGLLRFGKGALGIAGTVGASVLGLEGLGLGGALAGAGGMLASGAATAGTAIAAGAGAVASGIGALFTAPVLLGIAAVAAVGIGGYLAYKALTKRRLGLVSRVRYVQYGFSPMDKDHVDAVFALEDELKGAIVYGDKGAQIGDKKFDIAKILKLFDIDTKDKAAVSSWANWFSNRFKPVYLTHVTALRTTVANKWLSDVDSLELPLKKKYFQASKFPEGPYNVTDSPFKDLKALPSTAGDVRAIVQIVETELNAQTKIDESRAATGMAGVAGAAAVAAKTSANQTNTTGATDKGVNSAIVTAAAAGTMNTTGLGDARGQVTISGSSVVLESINSGRIDAITAVRLKTYGLTKLEADKVRLLLALEKTVGKDVVFTNKIATWSGSLEVILKNAAPGFGVEISDSEASKNWLMWFNRRFLPTFLNYVTAVTAQTGKQDYESAVSTLKPLQMTDVATAIYTSTTKTDGTTRSVWTVTASPWPNYELATDVKIVDPNMQGLKEMSKNAILPESGSKQPSKNVTSPAANGAAGAQVNKSETGIGAWISGAATKIKNVFTGESTDSSSNMDGGRKLDQPGNGTGGDVNAIPAPKGNRTWAALKDTILAAAKMVGVDGKLMAAMAALESGFDYTVKAGSSTAAGLFQFIDSTWKWMLKHFGAKYGISPGTPQTDPRANALMGAEYIKLNTEDLQRNLNRPLTDTDLYFAHFLGSGGASKFLKASPNAIAAEMFPDAARANKAIFYAKDGSPLSVGQVYQLVNSRVRSKGKSFGIDDGSEELVSQSKPTATSTAPGTSSDAKTSTKTDTAAVATPAVAAATTTTKTGIGAPVAPASAEKTATTATAPTKPSTDIPLSADLGGFTAPSRAMRDVANQAQMQQELKVTGMDTVNKTLTDSLGVQKEISTTLGKILAAVSNANQGNNPAQGNGPQQASNIVQPNEPRTRAQMKPSPVSMSRTMLNN